MSKTERPGRDGEALPDAAIERRTPSSDGVSPCSGGYVVSFCDGERFVFWDGSRRLSRAGVGRGNLACSLDGQRYAYAQGWRIHLQESGSAVTRDLQGDSPAIEVLTFSPDGEMLATTDGSTRLGHFIGIRLWEVPSGELLHRMDRHYNRIHTLVFSRGGDLLASCASNGTVRMWDVSTGQQLKSLDGVADSVAFSPDGRFLATSKGRQIQLFRLERDGPDGALDCALQEKWAASEGKVSEILGWAARGAALVTMEGTPTIWDVSRRTRVCALEHGSSVILDALVLDDDHIVTAMSDRSLWLWHVPSLFHPRGICHEVCDLLGSYASSQAQPHGPYRDSAPVKRMTFDDDAMALTWCDELGVIRLEQRNLVGGYAIEISADVGSTAPKGTARDDDGSSLTGDGSQGTRSWWKQVTMKARRLLNGRWAKHRSPRARRQWALRTGERFAASRTSVGGEAGSSRLSVSWTMSQLPRPEDLAEALTQFRALLTREV